MDDDCYLPWNIREIPEITKSAKLSASEGDPELLRNGIDRPIGESDNGWTGKLGSWIQYSFNSPQKISEFRFVFDSDLNRKPLGMPCNYPLHSEPVTTPKTMVREFRIEALDENGSWKVVAEENNNYQRLVRIRKNIDTVAVKFIPLATWGAENVHLFAWDIK